MQSEKCIRVHFPDQTSTTLKIDRTDTVAYVRKIILGRNYGDQNGIAPRRLFVVDSSGNQTCERMLDDDECPLEIQEKVRRSGRLNGFLFVLKTPLSESPDGIDSDVSSEEDFFSAELQSQSSLSQDFSGCLKKRENGQRSWRTRWFVLRGDDLFYYKNQNSRDPIATVLISDAFVREECMPGLEHIFSINTKQKLVYMQAEHREEMLSWIRVLWRDDFDNQIICEMQQQMESVEFCVAVKDEVVESLMGTLDGVMSLPNGCAWLCQFASEQHSDNLISFIKDEIKFKEMFDIQSSNGKLESAARSVFESVLIIEANLGNSIDSSTISSINTAVMDSSFTKDMFSLAIAAVKDHINHLLFPSFLRSNHCQNAMLGVPHPSLSRNGVSIPSTIPEYAAVGSYSEIDFPQMPSKSIQRRSHSETNILRSLGGQHRKSNERLSLSEDFSDRDLGLSSDADPTKLTTFSATKITTDMDVPSRWSLKSRGIFSPGSNSDRTSQESIGVSLFSSERISSQRNSESISSQTIDSLGLDRRRTDSTESIGDPLSVSNARPTVRSVRSATSNELDLLSRASPRVRGVSVSDSVRSAPSNGDQPIRKRRNSVERLLDEMSIDTDLPAGLDLDGLTVDSPVGTSLFDDDFLQNQDNSTQSDPFARTVSDTVDLASKLEMYIGDTKSDDVSEKLNYDSDTSDHWLGS
eukprot:213207_1